MRCVKDVSGVGCHTEAVHVVCRRWQVCARLPGRGAGVELPPPCHPPPQAPGVSGQANASGDRAGAGLFRQVEGGAWLDSCCKPSVVGAACSLSVLCEWVGASLCLHELNSDMDFPRPKLCLRILENRTCKLVDSRISVWNFWNKVTVPGVFGRQGRQARQGRVRGVVAGGTVIHQGPSVQCVMQWGCLCGGLSVGISGTRSRYLVCLGGRGGRSGMGWYGGACGWYDDAPGGAVCAVYAAWGCWRGGGVVADLKKKISNSG